MDIHQKLLEQKLLRATRARRRFKAAVRHVIYNMYWLDVDDEEEIKKDEDEDRVKYRLIRLHSKRQLKGLTIKEKAVLRKHTDYRTAEEITYLNKFIGGLKCFRPYPENVQLQLVGVTYFEYYGPGRVLIRQNDEGHAMYFLLSGEVEVTKTLLDEVTNCYVEEHIATISAGNTFGEIALLHNVPRTATCSTTAPCELLVLKKDDFDRVLKASLMVRWEAIREAMSRFVYFDYWDDLSLRECCLMSRIKSYTHNQIVYGDKQVNKQAPGMHYFIIQGRCSVVEHMYIEETEKCGKKYYKYLEPPDNKIPEHRLSKLLQCEAIMEEEESIYQSKTSIKQENLHTSRSKSSSKHKESKVSLKRKRSKKKLSGRSSTKTEIQPRKSILKPEEQKISELLRNMSQKLQVPSVEEDDLETNTQISEEEVDAEEENVLQLQNKLHRERRMTEKLLQIPKSKIPSTYKLVFVQICTLKEKASFPEGELLKHRRVIALNDVKVLLIPSYWLVQRNRANVWTRLDRFLHQRLPPSKEVFKAYVEHKKWENYKKKLRDEILSKKKAYNKTTIHDVPYSIRIMSKYN